jgi:hypothetical protein
VRTLGRFSWIVVGMISWTVVAANDAGRTHEAIRAQVVWESSVDDSLQEVSYVEPSVAISPRDPNRVAVAAIRVDESGEWRVFAFHSSDGGQTWSPSSLPGIDGAYVIADPWLYWSGSGTLYLVVLALRTTADGIERGLVYIYRSADQGESWSAPTMLPHGTPGSFDRPVIDGIIEKDGVEHLAIFATPPSVYRSRAGGEGFHEPALVLDDGRNNIMGAGTLALDGAAVITWMALENEPVAPLIVGRMDTLGAVVQTMLDSTAVWRGASIVAADRSGESSLRGSLYAIWTSDTRGEVDTPEVLFASSLDGGRTWSPATVLSDPSKLRFRAIPYVAVASDGVLGATWYEGSGLGPCGRPVFRASSDGGRSWSPTIPMTDRDRCPEDGREFVAGRWPWGSDYGALAAAPDGGFLAAWSDARQGTHRVRVAKVEVGR